MRNAPLFLGLLVALSLGLASCAKKPATPLSSGAKKAAKPASEPTDDEDDDEDDDGSGSASGSASGSGTGSGSASQGSEIVAPKAPGEFEIEPPAVVQGFLPQPVSWTAAAEAPTYDVAISDAADCAAPVTYAADLTVLVAELPPQEAASKFLCVSARNAAGVTAAKNNGLPLTFTGNLAPTAGTLAIVDAPSPFQSGAAYKARVTLADYADPENDPPALNLGENPCVLAATYNADSQEWWLESEAMPIDACLLAITVGDGKVDCDACAKVEKRLASVAMVKNANPKTTRGGMAAAGTPIVALGDKVIFVASTLQHGQELWVTDGVGDNTTLLKDVFVGTGSGFHDHLVVMGTFAYFSGRTAEHGVELWRTDGTTANTKMVKDLSVGVASSGPANLFADGTTLYFTAASADAGNELWMTDGTSGGTKFLKDVMAGTGSGLGLSDAGFAKVLPNGPIVFRATDAASGTELWKTDGTTAGTTLLKDVAPGAASSNPSGMTALAAGNILFSATNGTTGQELYATNGTLAGTAIVKDLVAGAASSSPGAFLLVEGKMYFHATVASSVKVFVSDGTTAGTLDSGVASVEGTKLMGLASKVFFWSDQGGSGPELYTWAGVVASPPVLLKNVNPVAGVGGLVTGGITANAPHAVAGTLLYFVADDDAHGAELWETDGTSANTTMVKDVFPGDDDSFPRALYFHTAKNQLVFAADDGEHGRELWRVKGDDVELVKDLETADADGAVSGTSAPLKLCPNAFADDKLYFLGNDGEHGNELFVSDGTTAGTKMIRDVRAGKADGVSASIFSCPVTVAAGKTVFIASDSAFAPTPWVTNDADGGTSEIAPADFGAAGVPKGLTAVGTSAFLCSNGKLWRTQGTTATTTDVTPPSATVVCTDPLVAAGAKIYFTATLTASPTVARLFVADADGSNVLNLTPAAVGTAPAQLVAVGSKLYFVGTSAASGAELFFTDGTVSGTVLVSDIVAGVGSSMPSLRLAAGGSLYFTEIGRAHV